MSVKRLLDCTPSELARAFAAIVRSQAENHLSPSIL